MLNDFSIQEIAIIPIIFKAIVIFFHSFCVGFFTSKRIAQKLKKLFRSGQIASQYLPEHKAKSGTPSMGGVGMVLAITIPSFVWIQHSPFLFATCASLTGFAFLGAWDDITKAMKHKNIGISPKFKLTLQTLMATLSIWALTSTSKIDLAAYINIPLFNCTLESHFISLALWLFLLVGTSNAVNLTDGLDSLCVRTLMPCFALAGLLGLIQGNESLALMFQAPFIPYGTTISCVCMAVLGSCSAFLWRNAPPASIFMGDTGSLALGGLLAFFFIALKQEFLLSIAGLIFVLETLSVIIQIAHYKRTKKPFFLCAPFHHHLQRKGLSEATISIRLGLLSTLFVTLSFFLFLTHAYLHTSI